MRIASWKIVLALLILGAMLQAAARANDEVAARLVLAQDGPTPHREATIAAAIWLTPLHGNTRGNVPASGSYTLAQKDKQFFPHLLVVPVGSTVHFPNEDPFFHNVFSLFDGRRFDLGLYEAGTTRDVTFSREGVSYIFCDIHPEMSAVVVSLATSYYGVADQSSRIRIKDVPPGSYLLHVWVEGEDEASLSRLSRPVQVVAGHTELGAIVLPHQPARSGSHANKFSQAYDSEQIPAY